MTADEFDLLTDRLRGKVQYLFFHLMGEPTLHPLLPEFVKKASEKGSAFAPRSLEISQLYSPLVAT